MKNEFNDFRRHIIGELNRKPISPVIVKLRGSSRWLVFFPVLLTALICCKKLVDVQAPVTSINERNVYKNDATAISVLTGVYANMSYNAMSFTGAESISLFTGLSSDELTLYPGMSSQRYIAYFKNALVTNTAQSYGTEHWSSLFNLIFTCNAAIENITASTALTSSVKEQLLGEAKFSRAFFYFYLVNLYGDVPLILTTDYAVNSKLAKSPISEVYQQIIGDLKDAQESLSSEYLNGSLQLYSGDVERVRPTKWAVSALLARVYLYTGDWADAEKEATTVINNSNLFGLSPLSNVFLKSSLNNKEAIWQLQPVRQGRNTEDGLTFVIPATGPNDEHPVLLNTRLLNTFDPGDLRKSNWVGSTTVSGTTYFYPYKYKISTLNNPLTEYLMVLRVAEQYLIRAEARAHLNKIDEAKSDLNATRSRAGLAGTTASNQTALISAILHERQVELFTELGQRWLDLKRTGNVDAVMTTVAPEKGGVWQSYQQLYPILYGDIQKDPNLSQNTGY